MNGQPQAPGVARGVAKGPDDEVRATPLPGAWPLLGHAPALLRDPLRVLTAAGRLGPVTVARLGPARAYVVSEPALIRAILVQDAADYDKGFQFDTLRALIGDGVGTSGGARHRRHRRLLLPAFDHAAVERHAADMTRQTRGFLESRWDRAADAGRPVDAAVELRMLAMRLIAHSMSGSEVAADRVMGELPRMLAGIGRRALLPIRSLDRLPTPGNRRFRRSLAAVHAVADGMVAARRGGVPGDAAGSGAASDQAGPAPGGPETLLDILLSAVDEDGAGLSDEEAHDEIMTLLLAGTETTAGVMAWTLHVLASDPVLQEQVRGEVLEATGGGPGTVARPGELTLTERVVKEVLRLYPPGWVLGRRALIEKRIGGVDVPARSQVLLNFYGLHRNPEAFPEPDRFDPDRWLELDPAVAAAFHLPFGNGPHGCLGQGYAWTELLSTACAVLARYRLSPAPGSVVRPVARTTLHPDSVPLMLARIGE